MICALCNQETGYDVANVTAHLEGRCGSSMTFSHIVGPEPVEELTVSLLGGNTRESNDLILQQKVRVHAFKTFAGWEWHSVGSVPDVVLEGENYWITRLVCSAPEVVIRSEIELPTHILPFFVRKGEKVTLILPSRLYRIR